MKGNNDESVASKSVFKNAVKAARQRMLTGYNAQVNVNKLDNPLMNRQRVKFLKEVYAIMNSDEIVTNPIERLANKKLMAGMTEIERSRYVLEVSREYLEERQFIAENGLTPEKIDELYSSSKAS